MSIRKQIERRLRDADMRFNPDHCDGGGSCAGEVLLYCWHPHREGRLVDMLDCTGEVEFGTGRAQTGAVLGGCVHRD